jgi:hypothetical protein
MNDARRQPTRPALFLVQFHAGWLLLKAADRCMRLAEPPRLMAWPLMPVISALLWLLKRVAPKV